MTAKTRSTTKSTNPRPARPSRSTAKSSAGRTATARARTASEDRLWKALLANPNTTTAQLSDAANVGKSTAGKILVAWADDGAVTRTARDNVNGRRAADLWATANASTTTTTARASAPTTATAADTTQSPAAQEDTAGRAPRLAPGALRGMVEDYLNAHPDEEFSPSAIGKALDRSAGAVNNVLEKLANDGYAMKTAQAPKRFKVSVGQSTSS